MIKMVCSFCGDKAEVESVESSAEVAAAHIRVCEKHPARAMQAEIDRLKTDLATCRECLRMTGTEAEGKLRRELAEAMDVLEKRGVVPDCDPAQDSLSVRIQMICDQEAWARQERDDVLAEVRRLRAPSPAPLPAAERERLAASAYKGYAAAFAIALRWDDLEESSRVPWARAAEAVLAAAGRTAPAAIGGIYVASRASVPERAEMWRRLRSEGWPIVSSWIDEDGPGQTDDLGELWSRIASEVTGASGLVLYAEPDDFPLKGALVEVGMALAAGVPVVVVAPSVEIEPRSCRPIGSWMRHPLVRLAGSAVDAFRSLGHAAAPAEGEVKP